MVTNFASRLRAAMRPRGPVERAPVLRGNTLLVPENQWYGPVLAGASTLAKAITGGQVVRTSLGVLERLTPDAYSEYVTSFYRAGLAAHGDAWQYADINTALIGLGAALKPENYLEIGVRRGRSLAMLAAAAPSCRILGCDLFIAGYAGMENPGPGFVRDELSRAPHGELEFLVGDSHGILPDYFARHPDAYFDLVTVDGDHSTEGASADLLTVMPRVRIGGALVFDDVSNPAHAELLDVWRDVVVSDRRFSTFTFTEVGFGVGIAVRHD